MSLDPNNKKACFSARSCGARLGQPGAPDESLPPSAIGVVLPAQTAFHAIDVAGVPQVCRPHEARRTHRAEAVSEKILTHLCLPSRALVVRQNTIRPAIGGPPPSIGMLCGTRFERTALLIPCRMMFLSGSQASARQGHRQ